MPEPLLFIHGWATDSGVWDDVAKEVGGERECINVRLPGHGGKKRWLEPTIAPAVRVVEEAVSSAEGGVVGIGWSLGGQALIKAAARSPGAFSALVLVGATPRFVSTEGFPHGQPRALVKRMIMDMKKDPASTVDRFYALNFTDQEGNSDLARAFMERYRYPGPVVCSDGVDAPPGCYPAFNYADITVALEALYSTDLCGELEKIKAPTLVVHGDRDNVCPPGAGEFLAENIAGAELKKIEGAGHAPFLTARDEFTRTLKGFIDQL